jgi:hypothetical protein
MITYNTSWVKVLMLASIMLAGLNFHSCQKDEFFFNDGAQKSFRNCYSTVVSRIDVPERILAGRSADFGVLYIKPTPCYELRGFQLESKANNISLTVCLKEPREVCVDMLDSGYDYFSVTFSQPGIYKITYKDYDGEKNIGFTVE